MTLTCLMQIQRICVSCVKSEIYCSSLSSPKIKRSGPQSNKVNFNQFPVQSSACIEYAQCQAQRKWGIPDLKCSEVKHNRGLAECELWIDEGACLNWSWSRDQPCKTMLLCSWDFSDPTFVTCYLLSGRVNLVSYQLDMLERSRSGKGEFYKYCCVLLTKYHCWPSHSMWLLPQPPKNKNVRT